MFATLIIVFREVLEAALITGVVLAATRGLRKRSYWVAYGILAGVVGAGVVALFANAIASAVSGVGQEIFNACVLFLAVTMLGWHSIWMSRHARDLSRHTNEIGGAVVAGRRPLYVLSVVIGLAVLREGSETVLFLYGITASGSTPFSAIIIGGLAGLSAGVVVGLLLYLGLLRIPARYLFNVIGWMVLLLVGGLASQGAAFLVQADLLPALGHAVWDTSALLSDRSIIGQILHVLIGYVSRPMGIQVLFYVITVITIGVLAWLFSGKNTQVKGAAFSLPLAVIAAVFFAAPQPVKASHKVYSPIVEKGEFELEFRAHRDSDNDNSKDGKQKHIYEISYGVMDRWYTALLLVAKKELDGNLKHEVTGWENIIQLTEQGEYWLDAGLYLEYKAAARSDDPDKFEFKFLLQKPTFKTLNTLNLIFEQEVGSNSDIDLKFEYAWGTKWKIRQEFEPGFEIYGELGELRDTNSWDDQEHQIGPVISGKYKFGNSLWKIGYDVGYLFGLTRATPDKTFKLGLELEFRF